MKRKAEERHIPGGVRKRAKVTMPSVSRWPTKEELINMMAIVGTTAEGAIYCAQKFRELVAANAKEMADAGEQALHSIEEYCRTTLYKHGYFGDDNDVPDSVQGKPMDVHKNQWDGGDVHSMFDNLQESLAKEAFDKLKQAGMPRDIRLDTMLAETIKRGYSVEEDQENLKNQQQQDASQKDEKKPFKIDAKILDSLDKIFNAWLAEHGIMTKGGKLYDQKNGTIITENGQMKLADKQRVRDLMQDPNNGLAQKFKQQGYQLTVVDHKPTAVTSRAAVGDEAAKKELVEEAEKRGEKTPGMTDDEGVSPSSSA